MKKASKISPYTIGIDLGDKSHEVCVIDAEAAVAERLSIQNTQAAFNALSVRFPRVLIIMEAGTHSPWISRHFESAKHPVIVANPRKLRAIYESENKSDTRDAEMLARIGRLDPNLLYAITHKSEEHQRILKILDTRDGLVSMRVSAVNQVRSSYKSLGIMLPTGISTEAFAKKVREHLNEVDLALTLSLVEIIEHLTQQIKAEDKRIQKIIEDSYPAARKFMTVPGVGPITALAFVLIMGSPDRFKHARDVGPYLGLVPRRDQSGEVDKELRISKCGNKMLRRLLISCAQYTLGAFGPPSALREAGERKMLTGAKIAKKKAVVMVARKIGVMLMALWKDPQSEYMPHPKAA